MNASAPPLAPGLERKRPSEDEDIAEIVHGILAVQARFAADQHRSLARGTHAKGICARAVFEVFDVRSRIADPRLASRLARGLFATPGRYPAIVRFANAEARLRPDGKPDVRALSFWIDVPPGVMGEEARRLDFSLNGRPTFPLNDAHAFAVFMRQQSAPGRLGTLKVLWSFSLRDLWTFFRTAALALGQQRGPIRPYQQLRYWSTVPFLHGATDAVKYSATPLAGNSAQPLGNGFDCLQDELVRHLTDDAEMGAFDFALQFLDADRMTRFGFRRSAPFWVENAVADWNESQAPFHIVGRLTLERGSQMPVEACERQYIDVTEHTLPEMRPIGSINRARWAAESASRRARLTGEVAIPPSVPLRRSWIGRITRAAAVVVIGVVAVWFVAAAVYARSAAANLPPPEHIDAVRYLRQGWGAGLDAPARQLYYYSPQGTSMQGIRYSWFVDLERPFARQRFAAPAHMRQLDFIVDPVPTPANPDQLPVGFARRYDPAAHDDVVDITCAACHTGQLNVRRHGRTLAVRIDGGQAMSAFTDMTAGSFQVDLAAALSSTFIDPPKFGRFAHKVLGRDDTWSNAFRLWRQVGAESGHLVWLATRGSSNPSLYPTQEGYGRTDALGRIANVVFGDHLDPSNYHVADAPVSYPYLWNIWKFDWVQYNASVSQPMARNIGEAMGVGAAFSLVDDYGRPIPAGQRYHTSIDFTNLERIESDLQTLTPPLWPEDVLGPIDRAKAARGKQLFNQYCVGCHGPHVAAEAVAHAVSPLRGAGDPLWLIRWKSTEDVGTDPREARNFLAHRLDLSGAGLEPGSVKEMLRRSLEEEQTRAAGVVPALQAAISQRIAAGAPDPSLDEWRTELDEARAEPGAIRQQTAELDDLDLRKVPLGTALTILGQIVRTRYYDDHGYSAAERACSDGFGTLDLPRAVLGYKPRPLGGVWATPPFLHNGSVPTLYDLLSPVSERPKRFYVGTRDFDPVKVGYATTPPPGGGGFWFDTTKPGNANTGHEFNKGYVPFDDSKPPEAQYQNGLIGPYLTPDQRDALIEYLKVRAEDEPVPAVPHVPPDCGGPGQASTAVAGGWR
ncbi:MAG TPA: di-heme-cytochrome C peroxidase [Vicinamibacterales bacterium]|jgi:hypothetical protein